VTTEGFGGTEEHQLPMQGQQLGPMTPPPSTSEATSKITTVEKLAATVSIVALVVSLGAAYFSYRQAERNANQSLVERVGDDLNQIAALSAQLSSNSIDEGVRGTALAQVKLHAAEAVELMKDREDQLSPVELVILANALTITSQPREAQRLLKIALAEDLDPVVRLEVLSIAANADLFLGDADSGRRKLEEASSLAVSANFESEILLRDAKGRVADSRITFELFAGDCDAAAAFLKQYAELVAGAGLSARVADYEQRIEQCQAG
jgi:hypothetical protein